MDIGVNQNQKIDLVNYPLKSTENKFKKGKMLIN